MEEVHAEDLLTAVKILDTLPEIVDNQSLLEFTYVLIVLISAVSVLIEERYPVLLLIIPSRDQIEERILPIPLKDCVTASKYVAEDVLTAPVEEMPVT